MYPVQVWSKVPPSFKLLIAFYAPEIIFIHIIAQKLQISHSSQISLSKQKICGDHSVTCHFTLHPPVTILTEIKIQFDSFCHQLASADGFYRKDDFYVCTPCHSSCTSCSTSKLCISCNPGYYLNISSGTCSEPDHNQCTDCTGQPHLDSWSSVCVPVCNDDYQGAAPCYTCSSTNGLWCTDQITRMISKLNMLGPLLPDQHEVLGGQPGGQVLVLLILIILRVECNIISCFVQLVAEFITRHMIPCTNQVSHLSTRESLPRAPVLGQTLQHLGHCQPLHQEVRDHNRLNPLLSSLWAGDFNWDVNSSGFSHQLRNFIIRIGLVSVWETHPVSHSHIHTNMQSMSTLDHFIVDPALLPAIIDADLPTRSVHSPSKPKRPAWYKAEAAHKETFSKVASTEAHLHPHRCPCICCPRCCLYQFHQWPVDSTRTFYLKK